ncbi:hypothetical protein [Demequina maris]|uniref:hypothetical protein n=1 Tax=Demequina maris TaxID=1638982 RepID=UPI000781DD82|nr:hypothetical protein [Demequina maris]
MTDVAIILTPIPRPRFLTALCAVNGIRGHVLETSGGPIAVLDDAEPASVEKAARAVSGFIKGPEFLVAESREGNVRVQVWKAGAMEREVPAGLALADSPGVVTSLLTRASTFAEIAETHEDKVHSTHLGRIKAYRELIKEANALRKDIGA